VPGWVPGDLPRSPGVYQFEDPHGTPLYVGKSVNLRRRVRGYFYGGGPADGRMSEMLQLAAAVRVHRTGSDLEALLEEAERIQQHRPPYNRRGKDRSRGWYIEVDWSRPFPRLRVVKTARSARAQYFGPYRGRRYPAEMAQFVERIFSLRDCTGPVRPDRSASACLRYGIGLCTAPCIGAVGINEYRKQVRAAARLIGEPEFAAAVRTRLNRARDTADRRGDGDAAIDWERRLGWLEDFETYRYSLERPWIERSWLIVLPGPEGHEGVLVPIARGRVLDRHRVDWRDPSWRDAVTDACYAVRVAELMVESVFPAAELAPSLIVTSWLGSGARGGRTFDLDDLSTSDVVSALTGPESR